MKRYYAAFVVAALVIGFGVTNVSRADGPVSGTSSVTITPALRAQIAQVISATTALVQTIGTVRTDEWNALRNEVASIQVQLQILLARPMNTESERLAVSQELAVVAARIAAVQSNIVAFDAKYAVISNILVSISGTLTRIQNILAQNPQ